LWRVFYGQKRPWKPQKSFLNLILPNFAFDFKQNIEFMEVITIEKSTWEQLLQEMQLLTARVEMLSRRCQDRKLSKWLDGDEVCDLLRISPRSLQELRSKHRIGYAQIGRKFYYRPEEVELVSRQQGLYINKV